MQVKQTSKGSTSEISETQQDTSKTPSEIVVCLYQLSLDLWAETDWQRAFNRLLELVENRLGIQESAIYLQLPGMAESSMLCTCNRLKTKLLRQEIDNKLFNGDETQFTSQAGIDICLYRIPGNAVRPNFLVLFDKEAFTDDSELKAWFDQLLNQLTTVMNTLGKVFRLRRQDIYEERLAISRELHDSLAQSLTYIKIQTTRLQKAINKERNDTDSEIILGELRTSVNRAYRELRELMTTFRLTMHGKSFNIALEESVKEFEQRSTLVFSLDNRLSENCLSVDEEMQVLQVIREGLSNAMRHSQASQVRVHLSKDRDNLVQIDVSDDGIGLDKIGRRERHHGLLIMQERVHALQGRLRLHELDSGGTQLLVKFRPGQTARTVSVHSESGLPFSKT